MEQQNPIPRIMSIVVDVEPIQVLSQRQSGVYVGGSIQLRNTLQTKSVYMRPDGTALLQSDKLISMESALLPYMFPYGTGSYVTPSKTFTFPDYLRFRMKTLFSPWTLVKPYLLLMYQVRQVSLYSNFKWGACSWPLV